MIEKIKIVYFAYLLPNNWENIVIEQLNSLKSLELYNIASNIYMSVISDENELKKLKNLLKDKYEKIELINVYNENLYEYPGFKTLYDMIDFDIAISLEVFEHLEKDIYVINKIPKNKRIIFSVPSFDDIAHVRFFKNENEIIDRFKNLFVEFNVYILDKIFIIDAKR